MSTFRSAEERFTTKHHMPQGSRSAVRPPPTPTKTTGTTQPTTLTKAHTRRRTISKSRHGARVKDTAAHTRCHAASMSTTHYANGVLRSHMIASPHQCSGSIGSFRLLVPRPTPPPPQKKTHHKPHAVRRPKTSFPSLNRTSTYVSCS